MWRIVARRACSGPAPRRGGVKSDGFMSGVEQVDAPQTSEGVQTKLTMDEVEERMTSTVTELERMQEEGSPAAIDPEAPDASAVLQRSFQRFKETEAQQSRISEEDGLFNMTPSGVKAEPIKAVRRFYKTVDVVPATPDSEGVQWWAVKLDGRNAKAFESEDNLVLPSEQFALAVAHEWEQQESVINRFAMPLMDVASGAHQVQPDGLPARIAYCLEFFKHDHLFYREAAIRAEQDEMMEPILEWADRYYDIKTPRVEGIRRCTVDIDDVERMRRALELMNMNKYQIVALTVLCQYMSSLVLPLAVFNNATSLEIAILINRIEEMNNIRATTEIEGYHDIRHLDSVVKMAACRAAWEFTKGVSPADCYADPSILRKVSTA